MQYSASYRSMYGDRVKVTELVPDKSFQLTFRPGSAEQTRIVVDDIQMDALIATGKLLQKEWE